MLHPELSLNNVVRQRFLREGYVANSVDHPGAVRVLDDDVTDDGAAFLVMELLEGESFEDRRDRHGGKLPAGEVLALIDQALDVLVKAHDKGIVHRDIKPDNLFLTLSGNVKVLDFGIAHLREHSAGGNTSVGTFMGTPSYMPPEQARARWDEVDARSDLWALGAVMFVLLSGRGVREADTVPEQLAKAVRDPAPLLGSMEPDLPDRVTEIVDRALSYEKSQRFQDARSMQLTIREAMKVVGRPKTISVAVRQPSSRRLVHHDDETMLASSNNPSTGGVARPHSTLASGGSAAPRRSRALWLVLGGIIAGLIAVTAFLQGRDDVTEPASSLAAEQLPTADSPAPPVPEVAPVLEQPSSASAQSATRAPAPSASASAIGAAAQRAPAPRTAKTPPAKAAPNTTPAAPKNPPPRGADPFDKRF
jgi:serine/threonine-protein kinase